MVYAEIVKQIPAERDSLTVVIWISGINLVQPSPVLDWLLEKHGKFRVRPELCGLISCIGMQEKHSQGSSFSKFPGGTCPQTLPSPVSKHLWCCTCLVCVRKIYQFLRAPLILLGANIPSGHKSYLVHVTLPLYKLVWQSVQRHMSRLSETTENCLDKYKQYLL